MSTNISKKTAKNLIRTDRLVDHMANLVFNSDYSDVVFLVEGQRLPAHRSILAIRCEFFRVLLFGDFMEATEAEITIDAPIHAFKLLLRYLYTGSLIFSSLLKSDILDVMALASKYGVEEVEPAGAKYVKEQLSVDNVCTTLNTATSYRMDALTDFCFTYMDCCSSAILKHTSFNELSKENLEKLLQRDSFGAPELDIFLAVEEWRKHNPNTGIESIASQIRLSLISIEDIVSVVSDSGMFDSDRLIRVIRDIKVLKKMPYRGFLCNF